MKTYSVKEVRDITGLTWKQLYEYKIGIPGIGPINDAGYKQYSKEDLEKLVQAALMAKLGAKPKDINKAFSDENYDRKKVLKELLDRAKRQLMEVQDIITVTENLLPLSNVEEVINPYLIRDLHLFAENIRTLMKDEDTLLFGTYLEKTGEDDLLAEIEKLKGLEESDLEKKKTYSLVRGLKKFGEETIGMNGNRFLMTIGTSLHAGEYVKIRVDNAFGKGKADIISKAIFEYMYAAFSEESKDELVCLLDYIGRDYDDEDVKKCIANLKKSIMKNFGLKTTFEFLSNIEGLKYLFLTDEDLSDEETKEWIDYIVGAVRHYEEQKVS